MSAVHVLPVLNVEQVSPHLDYRISDEHGNVVAQVDQTAGPRPGWWKRNVFGMVDHSSAVTLDARSADGAPIFRLCRDASESKEGQNFCRLLAASGQPLGRLEKQQDEYLGFSAGLLNTPTTTFVAKYRLYGADGSLVGEAVSEPIEMRIRQGGDAVSATGDHYVISDASGQEAARLEGTTLGSPDKRFTLRFQPRLPADLRIFALATPFAMKLV